MIPAKEIDGELWVKASDHQPVIDKSAAIRIATSLGWSPQRTWVGLTNEDTFEIGERLGLADVAWIDLMKAIEAKLKEKNT
jgi:hypothetical protein